MVTTTTMSEWQVGSPWGSVQTPAYGVQRQSQTQSLSHNTSTHPLPCHHPQSPHSMPMPQAPSHAERPQLGMFGATPSMGRGNVVNGYGGGSETWRTCGEGPLTTPHQHHRGNSVSPWPTHHLRHNPPWSPSGSLQPQPFHDAPPNYTIWTNGGFLVPSNMPTNIPQSMAPVHPASSGIINLHPVSAGTASTGSTPVGFRRVPPAAITPRSGLQNNNVVTTTPPPLSHTPPVLTQWHAAAASDQPTGGARNTLAAPGYLQSRPGPSHVTQRLGHGNYSPQNDEAIPLTPSGDGLHSRSRIEQERITLAATQAQRARLHAQSRTQQIARGHTSNRKGASAKAIQSLEKVPLETLDKDDRRTYSSPSTPCSLYISSYRSLQTKHGRD